MRWGENVKARSFPTDNLSDLFSLRLSILLLLRFGLGTQEDSFTDDTAIVVPVGRFNFERLRQPEDQVMANYVC